MVCTFRSSPHLCTSNCWTVSVTLLLDSASFISLLQYICWISHSRSDKIRISSPSLCCVLHLPPSNACCVTLGSIRRTRCVFGPGQSNKVRLSGSAPLLCCSVSLMVWNTPVQGTPRELCYCSIWSTFAWHPCGLPVTSCWRNEPAVSSNLLELMETGAKRKTDEEVEKPAVMLSLLQFERLTLTARFTCLSRVTGAAAEGGLEVMDGLLEDLPFTALTTYDSKGHYRPATLCGWTMIPTVKLSSLCKALLPLSAGS